ncbi:MAG: type I methionyl aminopeptidase [Candidatus Omnitrophica bacterium]|nr:type I methionyl aminopeptidase [Candidatus Omnitrophota bacterium]
MTILNKYEDISNIRDCGSIIKDLFEVFRDLVKEGVNTLELDSKAEDFIRERGGEPAFKGYRGYPATICASVNNIVVHGIPSEREVLCEGDIIGVDVGVRKHGLYTDAARTYAVGDISDPAGRLVDVTRRCLEEGVKQAVDGNRVSDISHVIGKTASRAGYKEVRSFVGHGIGKKLHETPEIPNWGDKGRGMVLRTGMLLAIEPMINEGEREVRVKEDGWTAVTRDGKLSAHFENTVMVGKKTAEILT